MTIKQSPTISGVMQTLNGKTTAVFSSRPYSRMIRTVDVSSAAVGAVTCYKGTPSGAFTRVWGSSNGSNQQYTQAFRLPAGQGLFVVWDAPTATLTNTSARINWIEDT